MPSSLLKFKQQKREVKCAVYLADKLRPGPPLSQGFGDSGQSWRLTVLANPNRSMGALMPDRRREVCFYLHHTCAIFVARNPIEMGGVHL